MGRRAAKPRPLRVDLENEHDTEGLLLASAALPHSSQPSVRIYPDVPWSERESRRQALKSTPAYELTRRRSVILHGIPECASPEILSAVTHDRAQWAYIKSKILPDVTAIRACYIRRLPRPTHLSTIRAPRLLRVSLADTDMVTKLLECWYAKRHLFPDIRIHEDQPRPKRMAHHPPNS